MHRFHGMADRRWRAEAEKALRAGKAHIVERRRGAGSIRPADRVTAMFPHLARLERARAVDAFGHDPQLLLPAGPQAVALLPPGPQAVALLPARAVSTVTLSERVEAAAMAKAPVQPDQVEELLLVVKLAVARGKGRPLYDGLVLLRSADVLVLAHPHTPARLVVGVEMQPGRAEFVSRRGELREFLLRVQEGRRAGVIHLNGARGAMRDERSVPVDAQALMRQTAAALRSPLRRPA